MSRADSNFERFYFIFSFYLRFRSRSAHRPSHGRCPSVFSQHFSRHASVTPARGSNLASSSFKKRNTNPGTKVGYNLVTAARRGTFGSRIRSAACLCGCRSRSREVGIVFPGAPNYEHLSINGKTLQLCTLLRGPVGKQLTHGGNRGRGGRGGGTGDVCPSRGGVVRSPSAPPGLEDDRVTGSAGLHRR